MLFAVMDTETTGLRKHVGVPVEFQPRVIEFAGIITDGDTILKTLTFRCNPGERLEAIITRITGITDEDLSGCHPFAYHHGDLREFLSESDAAIAHNLSFDKGMLSGELERLDMDFESINWPKVEACSVEETMPLYGFRRKLGDLYSSAIGPVKDAHSAMGDVRMLHEVCKAFGIYDALKERNS